MRTLVVLAAGRNLTKGGRNYYFVHPMVETSKGTTRTTSRFAVHLGHTEPGRQRGWTLCDRRIGLGDDEVIPYDVVDISQLDAVDCSRCLELVGGRTRRWGPRPRPPRRGVP